MTNFKELLRAIRYEDRRVLVVGLGISGIETSLFLRRAGVLVTAVERSPREQFTAKSKYSIQMAALERAGVELHFGIDGERVSPLLGQVGLAVVSPGVSHESAVFATLTRHHIPILSEMELGVELLERPTAIVTGSNGKSTCVTLLTHLLNACGMSPTLCGNVGVPVVASLTEEALSNDKPAPLSPLVVEASSYQLESCGVLRPKVGVFLNLSENHLERHGSMQRYFEAKTRLFARQESDDFAILNSDDPWVMNVAGRLKSVIYWFGRTLPTTAQNGARIIYEPHTVNDGIEVRLNGNSTFYTLQGSLLLGLHTRYNVAAALLAAHAFGADAKTLQAALLDFRPLRHRIEFLENTGRTTVINDSKSTTVAATVAAVGTVREAFPQKRLQLLAGGLVKAGSWEPLLSCLAQQRDRLEPVICFGGDGRLIQSHLETKGLPSVCVPHLRDAVHRAMKSANENTVVLLSPGCASFDEFTDFEQRGEEFERLVRNSLASVAA